MTSRRMLSDRLNLTERQIRTALGMLSKMKITTIQTTHEYSIITLVNWDKYQTDHIRAAHETTHVRPTNDPRATQEQEIKEIREEIQGASPAFNPFGHLAKALDDTGAIITSRTGRQIGLVNNIGTKHGEDLFKRVVTAYVTDEYLREKAGLSIGGFLNQFDRLASKGLKPEPEKSTLKKMTKEEHEMALGWYAKIRAKAEAEKNGN